MNLITDFTNGLVSKLYLPKKTIEQKKIFIDVESQNMIEEPDDIIMEQKNHCVDTVNIFVDNETNEVDTNNLIIGSGYDGYNSICWQRSTSSSDYIVFYKGNKYIISYMAIIEIINGSQNKTCSIEALFKIYIENDFNINLTIIQLAA